MKKIDLLGKQFHRLLVVSPAENTKAGNARWVCLCVCGVETIVATSKLRNGHTKSCGCLRLEHALANVQALTKHNHNHKGRPSRTYKSWTAMKARCFNPNHEAFHYYGGRGITVCKSWLAFKGFLRDMGERPIGKTLDRIDGNKGYRPSNCRWATNREQRHNRRH